MMISMNANKNITARPGVALLAVLMIVMVITIMALGFLSRSDVELACGENMALRTQMDHLAESGLEHARGLVLNPQDVGAEYWTGESLAQLVADSGDYYYKSVTPDDTVPLVRCHYIKYCK
jgi:type II secretory pathway component PulK